MDNDLISKLIDLGLSLFRSKALPAIEKAALVPLAEPVAPIQVQETPEVAPAPSNLMEIDWTNPKARLSANFSVGEALTLNSWGVMHVPSEDEKVAIQGIAVAVTKAIYVLAKELNKEIHVNVHAWMRPEKANVPGSKWDGQDYNRFIYQTQVWKGLTPEEMALKHVPNSPHKTGHAIDFHVLGYEGKEGCAKIRAAILPHLEELGLRMEHLSNGGTWIHLDSLPVVHERYFSP